MRCEPVPLRRGGVRQLEVDCRAPLGACCPIIRDQFDRAYVEGEIAAYRKDGPGKTAKRLADSIAKAGVRDRTLLDVGGGLGDIQIELFRHGLSRATHVEVSEAYVEAARDLAREVGFDDRVEFHVGDFVELAAAIPDADFVTLDRVICCYPDMPALLEASVSKARRGYAISVPRDIWPVRLFIAVENLVRLLKKSGFRTYVHPVREMDRRLRARGFTPAEERSTPVWRVLLYRRPTGAETESPAAS